MENNVPNLDAMDHDELMLFWSEHHNNNRTKAQALFGNRKGQIRAMKDLANYASNKATAITCRLEGKIQSALMYENIADRIYNNLPDWAKW